jgi:hypothetical protein
MLQKALIIIAGCALSIVSAPALAQEAPKRQRHPRTQRPARRSLTPSPRPTARESEAAAAGRDLLALLEVSRFKSAATLIDRWRRSGDLAALRAGVFDALPAPRRLAAIDRNLAARSDAPTARLIRGFLGLRTSRERAATKPPPPEKRRARLY